MKLIALSGYSGVGKDTLADVLVKEYNFCRIAFADPIKRIAREIYDFSDEQLWGPSEKRNELDKRYPREHCWEDDVPVIEAKCLCCGVGYFNYKEDQCYLTPRYALKRIGTEMARDCYLNTWIDYTLRIVGKLQDKSQRVIYNCKDGLIECDYSPYKGIVLTDCRFANEVDALKAANTYVVRIKRPGYEKPRSRHSSEIGQLKIPDSTFNYIFNNDVDISKLLSPVNDMIKALK